MSDTNKELARQWFEEIWNQRNPEAIRRLLHPEAVAVTEAGDIRGHEGFLEMLYEPMVGAFPDLRATVDGMVAEGENVVIRWTVQATHGGPVGPVKASGRRLTFSGMTWFVYRDGKIVEGWDHFNLGGLMAHLIEGTTCGTVKAAP